MSQESKKRPGEDKQMTRLYAAIGTDASGDEGIVGFQSSEGWVPLVFSTRRNLDKLKALARELADGTGETIRFVSFCREGVASEFKPGDKG